MKTCFRRFGLAVSTALLVVSQGTALAYDSPVHTFSINDVMGGFDGSTFGTGGLTQDLNIICGVDIDGSPDCPEDGIQPYVDKAGVQLYPVDSEFGFYIVDFLGAIGKTRDKIYEEGFVGNIYDSGYQVGIKISDAPTLKYKVKPPLGTWCQGLGGTSVKCETEHYVTMEHVLSCHEIIPYSFADPVTGAQGVLESPDDPPSLTFDCANAPLDDNVLVLVDGEPTVRLTDPTPCEDINYPEGCQMFPNDKTSTQDDVAVGTDYSVQLKDDGKPLYGWGGLHKRPNDVRMYARLELPPAWTTDTAPTDGYVVTKAQLVINHWITNNPNDQLRPEDLENEAATGRKPSYMIETVVPHPDAPNQDGTTVLKSLDNCYEGDGDFIEAGTYLMNSPFALDEDAEPGIEPEDDPYAFSSDLYGGFTNAFYTTINREPFEWSYVNSEAASNGVFDFIGSAFPLSVEEMAANGLELVSGPRWRLKPNKFGQDLPALEIPKEECSAPPFKSDNIKYVVGTPVTTVLNLLDWDEDEGPSPLATSKGWVDVTANEFVEVAGYVDGIPYSGNGLPMTDGFDLAVYVKGDSKSTAVFNAQLIIEYEGEGPVVPPEDFDLELTELEVPARVVLGETEEVEVEVTNLGPAASSGTVTLTLTGVSNRGDTVNFVKDCTDDLVEDNECEAEWEWTAPDDKPSNISWTATVTSDGDTNPTNDTATAQTMVRKK